MIMTSFNLNFTSDQVIPNVEPQIVGSAPPTSDFARMTVFSVSVDMAFNHDRGVNDGADGINIREDASQKGQSLPGGGTATGKYYAPEDNKMQPWVTVLETLTNAAWCGGNATVEQIAAAVTTNLYEGGKFRYEPSGPPVYQVYTALPYFNLTQFHNQITHPAPSPTTVGCADMAWGVKILSNLLGDDLKVVLIGVPGIPPNTTSGSFSTKQIHAIGLSNLTPTISWGNHVIACRCVTKSTLPPPDDHEIIITSIDEIYDACIKLHDGSNWVLATGFDFTKYKNLLTNDAIAAIYEEDFLIRVE